MDEDDIKFLDLRALNGYFLNELELSEIIFNNNLISGDDVKEFETKFSKATLFDYSISCGNGYDALSGILNFLFRKTGPGKILVQGNTFVASITAIVNSGFKPVITGFELADGQVSVRNLEEAMDSEVVAVLVVPMFGAVPKLDEIASFCVKHKLFAIIDAAQCFGSYLADEGSLNSYFLGAAWSFYPTKNLGALGDGGCVTTGNSDLAYFLSEYFNYGCFDLEVSSEAVYGVNSRLDSIQARFLLRKLDKFSEFCEVRLRLLESYECFLHDWMDRTGSRFIMDSRPSFVPHNIVLKSYPDLSDKIKNTFTEKSIPFKVHYHPSVGDMFGWHESASDACKKFSRSIISLPVSCTLSLKQIESISNAIMSI